MSPPRSGLVRGLLVGFAAMILAGAAFSSLHFLYVNVSLEVRWFAGNPAVSMPIGGGLLIGLLLALTFWLLRPRSLLVPFVALLYAVGARVLGHVGDGLAISIDMGFPAEVWPKHARLIVEYLPKAVREDPTFWPSVAAATVPVFLLTLIRALRLRSRDRAAALAATPEEPPQPEYRDPFEPAQPVESRTPTQFR
ncbi:hypothetical protein [Nonomuraea longicatena]|uniref:Uncharacterized protein n=1 Tax=Nonomuraea longicatena TaxID=83682 RepID=A0ABN1NZP4_9ACTN